MGVAKGSKTVIDDALKDFAEIGQKRNGAIVSWRLRGSPRFGNWRNVGVSPTDRKVGGFQASVEEIKEEVKEGRGKEFKGLIGYSIGAGCLASLKVSNDVKQIRRRRRVERGSV